MRWRKQVLKRLSHTDSKTKWLSMKNVSTSAISENPEYVVSEKFQYTSCIIEKDVKLIRHTHTWFNNAHRSLPVYISKRMNMSRDPNGSENTEETLCKFAYTICTTFCSFSFKFFRHCSFPRGFIGNAPFIHETEETFSTFVVNLYTKPKKISPHS